MWAKLKPYFISVFIALGVGGLSAILAQNNMKIYAVLRFIETNMSIFTDPEKL